MCFGLQQNMKVLKEPVLQRSLLQKSAAYRFSYAYLYLLILGNLSSIFCSILSATIGVCFGLKQFEREDSGMRPLPLWVQPIPFH